MRATILTILLLSTLWSYAQYTTVRRAMENMEDGDMPKARELLLRAVERDSLNPGIDYALSWLYNAPGYPWVNLDSSYFYILRARDLFQKLDEKEVDRLVRTGVDSFLIEKQKVRLDSQAFQLAVMANTVEGYQVFRKKFPTSRQFEESVLREHEVAYRRAVSIDTYGAFEKFMTRYPSSVQYPKALERYEILLFHRHKARNNLESWLEFLQIRPESPFRSEAESEILTLTTSGNRMQDFREFMDLCRVPAVRQKATSMVYHLLRATGQLDQMPEDWWTDSLRSLDPGSPPVLYPMVDEKGYFLLDGSSRFLDLSFSRIAPEYLCEGVRSELFLVGNTVENSILDRSGRTWLSGRVRSVEDLGFGVISVTGDKGKAVFLASGEQVSPYIYQDIRPLNGEYLAVQNQGLWGIMSFLGKRILPVEYDHLEWLCGSIILEKDGKFAITNSNALRQGNQGSLVFIYDEYERWPGDKIWVRYGDQEGLINNESSFDIELARQTIDPEAQGYVIHAAENRVLDTGFNDVIRGWQQFRSNRNFFAIRKNNQNYLAGRDAGNILPFDSVALWGQNFAEVTSGSQHHLVFPFEKRAELSQEDVLTLVKDGDVEYLMKDNGFEKQLFNSMGELVLKGNYQGIRALGKDYIIVENRGKSGLFSSSGEELLPIRYDAFGGYDKGGISLLLSGKLGYYNLSDSIHIRSNYERKILETEAGFYIAFQDGEYFLLDHKGERINDRTFAEIRSWNDSTVVVRTEGGYSIYDPKRDSFVMDGLVEFKWSTALDQSIMVRTGEGYGLLDPQKGTVIPAVYTFIDTIGDIYRAEKYLKDPDYYVVAYYNREGELLYRNGLMPDLYNKILCDNEDND